VTSLELDEIVAEARNKDTGSADEGVIYALKGSLRLIYSIAMCGNRVFLEGQNLTESSLIFLAFAASG